MGESRETPLAESACRISFGKVPSAPPSLRPGGSRANNTHNTSLQCSRWLVRIGLGPDDITPYYIMSRISLQGWRRWHHPHSHHSHHSHQSHQFTMTAMTAMIVIIVIRIITVTIASTVTIATIIVIYIIVTHTVTQYCPTCPTFLHGCHKNRPESDRLDTETSLEQHQPGSVRLYPEVAPEDNQRPELRGRTAGMVADRQGHARQMTRPDRSGRDNITQYYITFLIFLHVIGTTVIKATIVIILMMVIIIIILRFIAMTVIILIIIRTSRPQLLHPQRGHHPTSSVKPRVACF